jgi:Ca2+-dependent lipid-binding protein
MKAEAKLIEVRNLAKNKMVDTINKLNTGFNDHLKRKNIFLEEQNSSLKSTFQKLLGKTNDELDNLMKNVTEQNKQLEAQIEENKAVENHSKTIKSNFLKIEFDKLKYQNTILWYAFYVVLLILAFVMFFFTKFSFAFQIIVFILLLFYPFLIYYTELLLYILYSYSLAFFNSTKFESVYLGKY